MPCLLEIEGKWKSSGADKKSYSSNSAWEVGGIQLMRSKVSGLQWFLCVKVKHQLKTIKRLAANPKTDKITSREDNKRVSIQTSDRLLYLILSQESANKRADIVQKAISTLGMLAMSAKGNDMMSTDEVMEQIVSDDDQLSPKKPTTSRVEVRNIKRSPDWLKEHDDWQQRISHVTPEKVKNSTDTSTRSEPSKSFYGGRPGSSTNLSVTFPGLRNGSTIKDHISTPKPSLSRAAASDKPKVWKFSTSRKQLILPREDVTSTSKDKDGCNESAISDSEDDTLATRPLIGFANLGNSCYKNVVLQSLLSLDIFTADLLYSYKKHEADLEQRSLLRCLTELSVCKREKKLSASDQKELLKNVSKAVSVKTDRYSDFRQQDAHEFFCELLDMLKEEIISHQKQKTTNIPSAAMSSSSASINPTVNNFEFEVLTTLKCTGCSRETKISGTQNGLTVSIPEVYLQSTSSCQQKRLHTYIQDTLDCYFQSETVDCLCEDCGSSTALSVQTFSRLPRVLVIVVKRFQNRGYIAKNEQRIAVNKYITLARHCEDYIPLVTIPSIPIKLWTIPSFPKSSNSNDKVEKTPATSSRESYLRHSSTDKNEQDLRAIPNTPKSSVKKRLLLEHNTMSPPRPSQPSSTNSFTPVPEANSSRSIFTQIGAPRSGPRKYAFKALDSCKPTATSSTLNKVIDLESTENKQRCQTRLDDSHRFTIENPDADLERAMELSRQQEQEKKKQSTDFLLNSLSEAEQYNLAVQRSLKEVITPPRPLKESIDPGQLNPNLRHSARDPVCPDSPIAINSSDDENSGPLRSCSRKSRLDSSLSHRQNLCRSTGLKGGNPNSLTADDTPPPRLSSSPLVSRNSPGLFSSDSSKKGSSRRRHHPPGSRTSSRSRSHSSSSSHSSQGSSKLNLLRKKNEASQRPSFSNQFFSDDDDDDCIPASPKRQKFSSPVMQTNTSRFTNKSNIRSRSPANGEIKDTPIKSSKQPMGRANVSLFRDDISSSNGNKSGGNMKSSSAESESEYEVVNAGADIPSRPDNMAREDAVRKPVTVVTGNESDHIFTDDDDDQWTSPAKSLTSSVTGNPSASCSELEQGSLPSSSSRSVPCTLTPDTLGKIRLASPDSEGGVVDFSQPSEVGGAKRIPIAKKTTRPLPDTELNKVHQEEEFGYKEPESVQASNDPDKENVRPSTTTTPPSKDVPVEESSLPKLLKTSKEIEAMRRHDESGTEFGYSYKLVGIVSHLGSDSSYGHYVNDVYNVSGDVWLSYDDSRVTTTDVESVCRQRQRTGYMFLYMDNMLLEDLKHV